MSLANPKNEMNPIKPKTVLAIETSTNACSVALCFNDQILQRYETEPRAHTRILMPMIDSILKEAELSLSQIELFAYGCGPGSFTGVRIASAVIQGLGFGVQKPIIPVSSLRALAQRRVMEVMGSDPDNLDIRGQTPTSDNCDNWGQTPTSNRNICAVIDARMQEIYWGLFKTNEAGIVVPFGAEQLSSKESITLPEGDWILAEGYPRAQEVAIIAQSEYILGHAVSAEDALPVYLRNQVV